MKPIAAWLLLPVLLSLFTSCKKDNKTAGCFAGELTTRKLANKKATIKLTATITEPVCLVEEGAIDTRLLPCNLPMEFYQHDLVVTVSGDVKAARQTGQVPCCAENLAITAITR
ncbi:MAG: hypothetical protein EOP49_41090 [Sphingobacteriales bacterium]|nr:MAG: hypothetical protein EOP49_41090 [Sphingobacteriales bacterium]